MSIKKSQQFSYFQNKAHHYQNLRNAKSTLDNKHSQSMRHTIDHTNTNKKNKKLMPHLKKYEMEQQNQHLMQRLFNIMNSKKSYLNTNESYSRFNNNERKFRKSNPQKHQQSRIIDLENEKINKKLNQIKPFVGSVDRWKQQYGTYVTHRNHVSRYIDQSTIKGSLQISLEQFVPNPYMNLIETDKEHKKVALKLFELPKIPNLTQKEKIEFNSLRK